MEFEHPRRRKQREERQTLLAGIQYSLNLSREEMAEKFKRQGNEKAKVLSPSLLDDLGYDDTNPAHYILDYLSGQK